MASLKIRLDHDGIGDMLKSGDVAESIGALAEEVAAEARADPNVPLDVPVQTSAYVTDRAAVAIDLHHPSGLGLQAKYGVLTKAAGAVGLEVKSKHG
jgi:hypothetical protein